MMTTPRRNVSFGDVPTGDEYEFVPPSPDGMRFAIVRTRSAGVFAGWVKSRSGQEVVVVAARRLWYWSGAASLSQLSVDGTSKPEQCKFPVAVPEVWLPEVIELLWCTAKAKASLDSVAVWRN